MTEQIPSLENSIINVRAGEAFRTDSLVMSFRPDQLAMGGDEFRDGLIRSDGKLARPVREMIDDFDSFPTDDNRATAKVKIAPVQGIRLSITLENPNKKPRYLLSNIDEQFKSPDGPTKLPFPDKLSDEDVSRMDSTVSNILTRHGVTPEKHVISDSTELARREAEFNHSKATNGGTMNSDELHDRALIAGQNRVSLEYLVPISQASALAAAVGEINSLRERSKGRT